jgi:O-antigen ligase
VPPDPIRPARVPLLVAALGCAVLALAVLLPPEIDPIAGAACKALLAAAIGLLALEGGDRPAFLPAWTWGLLPFAIVAIATAACRARALDEASDATALILAALIGRRMATEPRARDAFVGLLVTLACVAALRAVMQHHVIYPIEAGALRAGGGEGSALVLARLEAGRPSGPFTLPAALGGFLAMSLPLTLALMRRAPGTVARAGILLAALLQGYALFLTRSVGALLATTVSIVLALPFIAPGRPARLRAGVLALAIAGAAFFLYARRGEIGSPGSDPFLLRAGNWRAAVLMIRDHPLFGTGPGSFGTFYPRYIEPGMNETRYAHDSYLQAVAGWGAWAIVPLILFAAAVGSRLRSAWRAGGGDLPVLAAGAAFLVHNLIDFTAFLPGVALPASVLLGAGLATQGDRERTSRRAPAALALVLALALPAHAVAGALSRNLLKRAQEAASDGEPGTALALARLAAARRPSDPSPPAFISEWVLAHGMRDMALGAEGERAALLAARLDPESAIRHYTLSLYHAAAERPADAYRELLAAHRLYPLKELYRAGLRPFEARNR